MIFSDLSHCRRYDCLGPLFARGLEWLVTTDVDSLEPGKIELDGERLFAMVQAYTTKPVAEARWEGHRRYADIQFLRSGMEIIGWQDISRMREVKAYDETIEAAFFEGEGTAMVVRAGQLCIYFPEDVHQPGVAVEQPAPASKIVVKVLLDRSFPGHGTT